MRHLSFFCKGLPLTHAEPVLLVRDDQCEGTVAYLVLNQGVRSDDKIRLSGGNFFIGSFLLFRIHGTDQQNRFKTNTVSVYILCDRFIMLHRKDFRGRHQSPLIAVGGSHQQGEQGQDRFSGTNIALNQSVHT